MNTRKLILTLCTISFISFSAQAASLLDFRLPSLHSGQQISLEKFRGQLILLSFFEPGCAWCYRQMKAFNRLTDTCTQHIQPLAVGINGKPEKLRRELRRAKVKFPAFSGTRELLSAVGKVPATPWTLVADSEGAVISTLRGYMPLEKLTLAFGGLCKTTDRDV